MSTTLLLTVPSTSMCAAHCSVSSSNFRCEGSLWLSLRGSRLQGRAAVHTSQCVWVRSTSSRPAAGTPCPSNTDSRFLWLLQEIAPSVRHTPVAILWCEMLQQSTLDGWQPRSCSTDMYHTVGYITVTREIRTVCIPDKESVYTK